MSKRPIRSKQAARLRKDLNRETPASFVNLYDWLKSRRYVRTRAEAEELILAGCVQVDGEAVGIGKGPQGPYALGYLDSSVREKLTVAPAGAPEQKAAAALETLRDVRGSKTQKDQIARKIDLVIAAAGNT